jgi:hypothetical protein
MSEIAISLPFSISDYGTVTSTTDQRKIWADRVRFVIGTNLEERILDPQFGTLVPSAFMESENDAQNIIVTEVERAFAQQLTLLTLGGVEVSFDEYTSTTNVNITYDLPNGEVVSTVVGVSYIDGKNPLVQENL